ncbi:MAG: HsdM family class I SAM-dependent methyltransferase [bacterium JZ-2024 1]
MTSAIAQTQNDVFFSDAPEREYALRASNEHVKKLGQFFTPFSIARFMAKWIISNPKCRTILDPAVGLGIFFRAILKEAASNSYQLIGYDIDPQVLKKARTLFQDYKDYDIRLINRDYMFNDWNNRYDGIICNPPYQRFQNYKNRNEILAEFQSRLGLSLSGLTNLHTLFLLKSVNQLSENGRAAYIVPSEFLNADYGVFIKRNLIKYKSLKYILVFDFNENLFDNVITTSCILLFDNSADIKTVEFIAVKSLDDLAYLESQFPLYPNIKTSGKAVLYEDLDEGIKWRAYYQKQNGSKYKNLVPLLTYGKVVRGIATGDNDYFTFNEQKKREFEIEDRYLLPCLTKANQASSYFFTQEDFEKSKAGGKNIYLLNITDVTSPAIRRYIQLGEKLGVHKKYLTSHRTPWYAIENRLPAPILVTVFNRTGLRFVRNEANVRNLTCFHCFYLNIFAMEKIDILMAYLMTDVAREIFNDNRREYGNGLGKFEPNDLNNAKVIDLHTIPQDTSQEILEIYNRYRLGVIRNRPDITLLEALNKKFFQLLIK